MTRLRSYRHFKSALLLVSAVALSPACGKARDDEVGVDDGSSAGGRNNAGSSSGGLGVSDDDPGLGGGGSLAEDDGPLGNPFAGGANSGGSGAGGASVGGARMDGAGGRGEWIGCRPGDTSCGVWVHCDLEFRGSEDELPKTVCSDDSFVSAASTTPLFQGTSGDFDLVASPPENILIAGRTLVREGAVLGALTPALDINTVLEFEGKNSSLVRPQFLVRGTKGTTFVVGALTGYLFSEESPADDQDVFVWSSDNTDLTPKWSWQLDDDRIDSVFGATALPDGGLAAVGSTQDPNSSATQHALWTWNENGDFTRYSFELFGDSRAADVAADGSGNVFVITTPPTKSLIRFSGENEPAWSNLGESGECDDCARLVATSLGHLYLLGTAPRPDGTRELRVARRAPDGKLSWWVPLAEGLEVAAMIAKGEHVVMVGSLTTANYTRMAVLLELDDQGNPTRKLAFGTTVSVLSASLADTGRVDIILRDLRLSSIQTFLVQIAP